MATLQDVLAALQGSGVYNNTGPLPKILPSHDIKGISSYILSDQCKKISVLAGAGISVSAGIPDFRSKGGFYNTLDLSQYPLTDEQRLKCEQNSEYILTYELFKENPNVYITARRDMILAPTKYSATLSHWFVKLLYEKSLLKRYYSTNIDGLDAQIKLPDDIICNVHGSLGKAHCIKCGVFVDMDWFRDNVEQRRYPIICPQHKCDGFVKPNTVLFGQSLPQKYNQLVYEEKDLDDVDLFIVVGTSLAVAPSNYLPQKVNLQRCARVLINRDSVAQRFEFENEDSNDVWLKGNADEKLRELTKCLGWERDLFALLPQHLKEKERSLLGIQMEDNKMNDDTSTKLSDRQQIIQSLMGGNTSFMNKTEIDDIWMSAFNGVSRIRPAIFPVIFVQDPCKNPFDTVWKSINHNIHLVLKYNFDGIILVNHGFMCKDLLVFIEYTRSQYPDLWIGVNFLGCIGDELEYLMKKKLLSKVNALWIENCGISFAMQSDEIIKHSKASDRLVQYRETQSKWMNGRGLIFGGIEFDKDNTNINNYDRLCKKLGSFASKGFMHCVCTSAIGDYYHKIDAFKKGIKDRCKLAVSHGVTAENVHLYLGIADAIFLNKGLSDDDSFYNFNEFKMSKFRKCIQAYYDQDPATEKKANHNVVNTLSPVNEEKNVDDDKTADELPNVAEEFEYQIHIANAHDLNSELNGIYKPVFEEKRLPHIIHKTDSIFCPNFMYYLKSEVNDNEYGIFIIPSLESMHIYKPTWVIAQINKSAEPVYYYASRVDFKQQDAMKIPNQAKWLIVGDDDNEPIEVTMKLSILKLAPFQERRRNFSAMHSKKSKEKMKEAMLEAEERNEKEKKKNAGIFDVDDHKISCVEEVGHDNILRVTDDIKELEREWKDCELGNHDELEMFLGAVGKVIDVEEDDDTVKLEWMNNDYHWLPVKACWITWKHKNITAPNFYPDQDERENDSQLLNNTFGGSPPQ